MGPPAKLMMMGLLVASASSFAEAGEGRPVALVESIENAPQAEFRKFQYVYEGDTIDLRDNGVLTLAYFDTCEVVTFTGGVVKLKKDGTSITKDGTAEKSVRPCQTSALAVSQEASEAGAAVKRVSPFSGEQWREISIASAHPRFIWPDGEGGDYAISVFYLDAAPIARVWQARFENPLVYPDDAPPLEPGMPYKVVITGNGKEEISAVFSIDPALELPESPLTSAIPLGL